MKQLEGVRRERSAAADRNLTNKAVKTKLDCQAWNLGKTRSDHCAEKTGRKASSTRYLT